MEKQIANLRKQNEGMELGFKNKGVEFNKMSLNADMAQEMELQLLKDYNEYLKNISKNNRPPPQEKEQPKPKSNPVCEEEDIPKEVKPVFSTIANMEDIKRAFFSKEYDSFNELVREHPFRYYKVEYRYSSDNDGRPGYVAKNLLRGFVQRLDDYRNYLMVCFRCTLVNKETIEYRYPSYWVVNTNDDIAQMLGELYDDYEFISVTEEKEIGEMLKKMEKTEDETDETLIGEVYLH